MNNLTFECECLWFSRLSAIQQNWPLIEMDLLNLNACATEMNCLSPYITVSSESSKIKSKSMYTWSFVIWIDAILL